MKTRTLIFVFVAMMALVSCKNTTKEETPQAPSSETETELETPDNAHNSENSLDWPGEYEGVLPCADCPGIQTKITLNDDKTYELEMEYLERESKVMDEGDFEWFDNGSKIRLKSQNKDEKDKAFLVGENQLFQLDENGERATGELADKFTLKKTDLIKE